MDYNFCNTHYTNQFQQQRLVIGLDAHVKQYCCGIVHCQVV